MATPRRSLPRPLGRVKPLSPRLRYLQAVDTHKPYDKLNRRAQIGAWRCVRHDLSGVRPARFDVVMRFDRVVTAYANGTHVIPPNDTESARLVAKLAEDAMRCERVGRERLRRLDDAIVDRTSEDEEIVAEAEGEVEAIEEEEEEEEGDDEASCRMQDEEEETQTNAEEAEEPVRRSKRLRDKEAVANKRKTSRKKQRMTKPSIPAIDPESDEEFLHLLLQHMPHAAIKRSIAWPRLSTVFHNPMHFTGAMAMAWRCITDPWSAL